MSAAADGRMLGARADALEVQAFRALNRAKEMLLRGHWDEVAEALRAAEGSVAGLREIEATAAVSASQALRHSGTQALET